MKAQSKFTLIAAIGIIVTIGIMVAVSMGTFKGNISIDLDMGARTTRTLDLKDFTSIDVNSVWQVEVTQGESWAVEIEGGEKALSKVKVAVNGSTLGLDYENNIGMSPNLDLKARITMPRLEGIQLDGTGSVKVSGMTAGELSLVSSGVGEIKAEGCTFGKVKVDLSGVGSVDLMDSKTRDAHVVLSGVGSLEIRMDGGELSGELSGVGSIKWAGTASSQTLKSSGLGSIEFDD